MKWLKKWDSQPHFKNSKKFDWKFGLGKPSRMTYDEGAPNRKTLSKTDLYTALLFGGIKNENKQHPHILLKLKKAMGQCVGGFIRFLHHENHVGFEALQVTGHQFGEVTNNAIHTGHIILQHHSQLRLIELHLRNYPCAASRDLHCGRDGPKDIRQLAGICHPAQKAHKKLASTCVSQKRLRDNAAIRSIACWYWAIFENRLFNVPAWRTVFRSLRLVGMSLGFLQTLAESSQTGTNNEPVSYYVNDLVPDQPSA